jgi:hypothetical protein
MGQSKSVWSPIKNGLSLSGLELWLVDRVAFELSYLRNLEVVEPWNKNLHYGLLVGNGIEGLIKTQQLRGAAKFIDLQYQKQAAEYDDPEIGWWTKLAQGTLIEFDKLYSKDLKKYGVLKAEEHYKIDLELPSGRTIVLHGYMDGDGEDIIFENKCRGDWDTNAIAREIERNLQINFYMLMFKARYGRLPSRVWYQNVRRPGAFGYHGPRKRTNETSDDYGRRIIEHMKNNIGYYFFRYMVRPNEQLFDMFLYQCLVPMLEAFLDWYSYMTSPNRDNLVNKFHWITPYGLYNPFMEGTQEKFREFRLTGSTMGMRKKVSYR